MKKNLVKVIALSTLSLAFASCATKAMQGTGVTLNQNKPEIIDYKGQAFGADIPAWVLDAANGEHDKVAKDLRLTNQKVWVINNSGEDLDILKLWSDQIDGRSQIASGIEQTVGDLITAELQAKQIKEIEKSKEVEDFSTRMTNITLQGLDKVTDYWTKTRTLKVGLKKAKSENDYVYKYNYLVVFAMDNEIYSSQIDAAFADVDYNDEQSMILRDLVTDRLKNKVEYYKTN